MNYKKNSKNFHGILDNTIRPYNNFDDEEEGINPSWARKSVFWNFTIFGVIQKY